MYQFESKSVKTISLRLPALDDVQIMLDYINAIGREDIFVNVNPRDLYNVEQEEYFVKDILAKIKANRAVYYLVFHQDSLIGTVSVFARDKRQSHVGVFGITIAKDYRGDGIGEKVANYTIDQAKKILKVKLIILNLFQPNQVAHNLYQKLGFHEYGRLPQGLSYKDGFVDSILMYKQV